jgi:hypothetical protein
MRIGSHKLILVWSLGLGALACGKSAPPANQTAFDTPEAAVTAFVAAARANDAGRLDSLLGNGGDGIVTSSDTVADNAERARFVKRYDEKSQIGASGPDEMTLTVGPEDWPLPIPLVKTDGKWHWDGAAGREEVFYRRIGNNELNAIQVCRNILDAQQEYAASGHDGKKAGAFAKHLMSKEGTQDGLYWPAAEGETPSPAGPLLAQAGTEGYETSGVRTPYHGYYYRMLSNGKGFGFVAYPADYRESGVMTFQVSQTGAVYQKDLGTATDSVAQGLTAYAVDSTWAEVAADQ